MIQQLLTPDAVELPIEDEFRDAQLGDTRRTKRLLLLAQRMSEQPAASFPSRMDDAELEATYRFFNNDAVTAEAILGPHVNRTVARASSQQVVLAVHDTSTMSFRPGGKRKGLGAAPKGGQEFLLHATLAVAADGSRRPLGVLDLSTHVPQRRQGRKARHRRRDPAEFRSDYDRWGEQIQRVAELDIEPDRTRRPRRRPRGGRLRAVADHPGNRKPLRHSQPARPGAGVEP